MENPNETETLHSFSTTDCRVMSFWQRVLTCSLPGTGSSSQQALLEACQVTCRARTSTPLQHVSVALHHHTSRAKACMPYSMAEGSVHTGSTAAIGAFTPQQSGQAESTKLACNHSREKFHTFELAGLLGKLARFADQPLHLSTHISRLLPYCCRIVWHSFCTAFRTTSKIFAAACCLI